LVGSAPDWTNFRHCVPGCKMAHSPFWWISPWKIWQPCIGLLYNLGHFFNFSSSAHFCHKNIRIKFAKKYTFWVTFWAILGDHWVIFFTKTCGHPATKHTVYHCPEKVGRRQMVQFGTKKTQGKREKMELKENEIEKLKHLSIDCTQKACKCR
jgi:hypothetical protein